MSTLILDKVLSGYNLAKVNDNFERIEKAFNEALVHRDGSKELTDDLDVNNQKLLNVRGIEIDGVDITESVNQLREEYTSLIDGIQEYQSILNGILAEAISYGAVDKKSIGNAQTTFTTTQNYVANATLTLPLPYVVGKNTLRLNQNHYYEFFKGVDYEEVGTFNTQSTTIKLLKPVSTGVVFEQFVDGDNDLYSIYSTAEALQTLLTTSYTPESISAFVDAVSDIEELGLEDKIEQLNTQYEKLVAYSTALQTTVADINTKYSTITDMYEDVGTKYSLLETLYPQLLNLISDTDFDLDDLNSAIGDLNDAIEDINEAMEDVQGYADAASDSATEAAGSASDAADSALEAASYVSTINTSVNNARIWAEGTDEEVSSLSGTHSAKEWAAQAESVQNAVKYTSQSLTSSQQAQARTNINAQTKLLAAQMNAVNSGITSAKVATYDNCVDAVVNAKDYGAKGDGVTDDADSIQDALISARGTGKTVFLPPGTYKLGHHLAIYTDTKFFGYGATLLRSYNTDSSGTGSMLWPLYYEGHYDVCKNIDIRGITFDANGQNFSETNLNIVTISHNTTGCLFKDISFIDCTFKNWINLHAIDANSTDGLKVIRCKFTGVKYDDSLLDLTNPGTAIAHARREAVQTDCGGYVDADAKIYNQNWLIQDCYFGKGDAEGFGSPRTAIGTHSANNYENSCNKSINIIGCTIDSCDFAGVTLYGCKNSIVSKNTITNCKRGIQAVCRLSLDTNNVLYASRCENVIISDNVIVNETGDSNHNKDYAIFDELTNPENASNYTGQVYGNNGLVITNNEIGGFTRGCYSSGAHNLRFSNNRIYDVGMLFSGAGDGIDISENDFSAESGCLTYITSSYWGFVPYRTKTGVNKKVVYSNNSIKDPVDSAFVVDIRNHDDVTITANRIYVSGDSSSSTRQFFNAQSGIGLAVVDNVVISDAKRNISAIYTNNTKNSGTVSGNIWITPSETKVDLSNKSEITATVSGSSSTKTLAEWMAYFDSRLTAGGL